jgi:bifunctional non-homologous end joining protein LigD
MGELLARAIAAQRPDIATVERVIGKRGGRVYVDFLQNGYGKLLVSPYCVRPLAGAPVSLPLEWNQVKPGLTATAFNLRNAVEWIREHGDPMREVLDLKPNLVRALGKLQERM